MSDLRIAAQQALERLRKYHYGNGFAEDAECIADLEAALAQEQAEPVRSPSTPQEKEMTDPNSVCFSLNTGAFPVEMLRLDGSGFHYKGKVIEDAGEAYNLFKQWLVMAQQPSQQAEPVAGKVVAWGVFAKIDGEWQLQHPVFAGDEQGKVNAEFERASYSGPQPLEVRPLGVVTATAQQAEQDLSRCPQCNGPADNGFDRSFPPSPYLCTKCMAKPAQDPTVWVASKDGRVIYDDASTDDGLLRVSGDFENDEQRVRYAQRIVDKLNAAPPQRKLVPLTEEEIMHIGMTHQSLRQVVRAVERAHGIKE